MRKIKKRPEERAVRVFQGLEKKIKDKRDMKEINDVFTTYLDSIINADFSEFDKDFNEGATENEYIDLALEKALLIFSLVSETSYKSNTEDWKKTYKIIKKIPLTEHILRYKFEKRGAEIFGSMGLEIIGFDSQGNLMTKEKADATEEQKKRWEEHKKDLGSEILTRESEVSYSKEKLN